MHDNLPSHFVSMSPPPGCTDIIVLSHPSMCIGFLRIQPLLRYTDTGITDCLYSDDIHYSYAMRSGSIIHIFASSVYPDYLA